MHKKQKLAVAWIFAFAGVLPFVVMVWFSLMPNIDILNKKYIPQPRENSVVFFEEINFDTNSTKKPTQIAATELGQIFVNKKMITDLNSVATVYARQENSLWGASADNGLTEISLKNGTIKGNYNWEYFEDSYNKFDPTRFYSSSDILPENFSWLADRLNSSDISKISGIKFYQSEEIINQLNYILTNEKILNLLFAEWGKSDGWLNPKINSLLEKSARTERENHFLFRWCLSELFPNKVSRFRYFPWENIWESQATSFGLSMVLAGNKIVLGMRGEIFPGVAIFDTDTKEINWITDATGLPNTSIHRFSQVSDSEILVIHDLGTSTIQQESGKVLKNHIAIAGNTPSVVQDTISTPSVKSDFSFIPQGSRKFQFSNYQDIAKTMPLAVFMKNSAIISLSIAVLCLLLAVFPSYAIARMRFKGKTIFSRALLSTQIFSGLPFLIPVFVIFSILQMNDFRLFNSYSVIIFVNLIFFLPMAIQFLFNIFAALPANLEESAILDGCNYWQAFTKVLLPAAAPGIAVCFIYMLLFAWDEILFIWILSTDLTTATLPVGIRMAVGQFANRPELLMAFCVVASAPMILLILLARPLLLRSLSGKER